MEQTHAYTSGKATLYYDGCCPLCMREMDRLGGLKSDDLELVDIHCVPATADLPDRDTLLRNLHLRLPDGRLLTGVDQSPRRYAAVARLMHDGYGRNDGQAFQSASGPVCSPSMLNRPMRVIINDKNFFLCHFYSLLDKKIS